MKLTKAQEERAAALHEEAIIIDGHADTIMAVVSGERHLYEDSSLGHLDIPRMKKGGLDVQFFAIFADGAIKENHFERGLRAWDTMMKDFEKAEGFRLVKCYDDILEGKKNGQTMGLISTEGGEILEGNLQNLDILHRLGVRCFGLVWNYRNALADGMFEVRTEGGLTTFGQDVIKRAEELSMLIDVSHLTEAGFWDMMEISKNPFVATHSNAKAICNVGRNLNDEQLIALSKKGGVTGLNYCDQFIADHKADLSHCLDHIDHIVTVAGVDTMALGSDFDGVQGLPKGLEDVTKLKNMTRGLVYRGYSDEEIKKILGGNWLRVIKEVIG